MQGCCIRLHDSGVQLTTKSDPEKSLVLTCSRCHFTLEETAQRVTAEASICLRLLNCPFPVLVIMCHKNQSDKY